MSTAGARARLRTPLGAATYRTFNDVIGPPARNGDEPDPPAHGTSDGDLPDASSGLTAVWREAWRFVRLHAKDAHYCGGSAELSAFGDYHLMSGAPAGRGAAGKKGLPSLGGADRHDYQLSGGLAQREGADAVLAAFLRRAAAARPARPARTPWGGTMPWLMATLAPRAAHRRKPRARLNHAVTDVLLNALLRGAGQAVFCNNPLTGLLVLVALAVQSAAHLCFGVLGCLSSTAAAALLGLPAPLVRSGLLGYNGLLLGLCLVANDASYGPSSGDSSSVSSVSSPGWLALAVPVVLYGALTSVLFIALGRLLEPYELSPFSLPAFVASLFYLGGTSATGFGSLFSTSDFHPQFPVFGSSGGGAGGAGGEHISSAAPTSSFGSSLHKYDVWGGTLRGVGQIFFCDSRASAALVLVGMVLCSRIAAVAAPLGSLAGTLLAVSIGAPVAAVEGGVWGLYGALCAVSIGGMFYALSPRSVALALSAAVLSTALIPFFATLMAPAGLPANGLGFCTAALLFTALQTALPALRPMKLRDISFPEEHVRAHADARATLAQLRSVLAVGGGDGDGGSGDVGGGVNGGGDHEQFHGVGVDSMTFDELMCRSSQEDFAQLRAVFERLAASDSGERDDVVSRAAVVGALTRCGLALTRQQATRVFQLVDEDEGGTLNCKEFFSVLTLLAHAQSKAHQWHAVFDAMDVDHSGTVSLQELQAYAKFWWSSGGLTAAEVASLRHGEDGGGGGGVLSAPSLHAHERDAEIHIDRLVHRLVWDLYLEQCREQGVHGDLKSLLDSCWRERLRIEQLQNGGRDGAQGARSLSPALLAVTRNASINV